MITESPKRHVDHMDHLADLDCKECGGAGFVIENDSALGEIMTGCRPCWIANQEHDQEHRATHVATSTKKPFTRMESLREKTRLFT